MHVSFKLLKIKCVLYPALLSCVSRFIDICTVAIKNTRNMHVISTNQIGDILILTIHVNIMSKNDIMTRISIKLCLIYEKGTIKNAKMNLMTII